jgi:glucokinase
MTPPRLLADIGATNLRFALLLSDGAIAEEKHFRLADYETLADAITAYITPLPPAEHPTAAALALAAPVLGDKIAMINAPWKFSLSALKRQFQWPELHAVNDFAANALAVPHLDRDRIVQIGEGTPALNETIAVLGPGTGLGVAGLINTASVWTAVAGEGGHATLAPIDSRETAVIEVLRRQYAHVSAERVLSGPGLVLLYDALCELAGRTAATVTPEYVTNLYPGCDPHCREAVLMFCAMLGTFTGNVALIYGSRGGVYIMGGIIPKIVEFFRQSPFRERFEFKGRYRAYVERIPTYVVMQHNPAFLGLKSLFK